MRHQPTSRISYTLSSESLKRIQQEESLLNLSERLKQAVEKEFYGGRRFKQREAFLDFVKGLVGRSSEKQSLILRCAQPALNCKIEPLKDFTFRLERNDLNDEVKQVLEYYQQDHGDERVFSYECKLCLWEEETERFAEGRVLACLCFEGRYWSLTFRKESEYPKQPKQSGAFLNEIDHIRDLLYNLIFSDDQAEHRGIIIVAGRTASAKSQIARGLIEKYLEDRRFRSERNSHLVTFEDPIERYFNPIPKETDYTPRQKGRDTDGLEKAISDALRQTPKIMLVGETRELKHWEKLIHFSGTGHLVVTTTHAGSLSEAMGNILQATRSKEPRTRSIIADRLLALVHLRGKEVNGKMALLPALWRRTPGGAKSLMSEGISSLLPNLPGELSGTSVSEASPGALTRRGEPPLPSTIGRYWFARELLKRAGEGADTSLANEVKSTAIEWDLEGV